MRKHLFAPLTLACACLSPLALSNYDMSHQTEQGTASDVYVTGLTVVESSSTYITVSVEVNGNTTIGLNPDDAGQSCTLLTHSPSIYKLLQDALITDYRLTLTYDATNDVNVCQVRYVELEDSV